MNNNRSFAFAWLDNNNSSVATNNYRRTSKNVSSGYSSCGFDEERLLRNFVRGEGSDLVVEEQIEKGFVNDGTTSRRSHFGKRNEKGSRISSSRWINKRGGSEMKENMEKVPVTNNGYARRGLDYEIASQKDSRFSSKRLKVANSGSIVDENVHRQSIKDNNSKNEVNWSKEIEKLLNKNSSKLKPRVGLDMCSKKGDVMGAISLYDLAVKRGVKLGRYQYTVLLYLCSSAAMGVICPAKSGSSSRSSSSTSTRSSYTVASQSLGGPSDSVDDDTDDDDGSFYMKDQGPKPEVVEIKVSDDVKKYALERGFEIYQRMCSDKVQMNEAALTSVARMAMAMGNGDMAFDMVKQMKEMQISPKLRSYGPALSVFSSNGDIEKAFDVEKHMLENGVRPEEPELEALLRLSVQAGKADKVYYLLHKLRTTVRSVSPSTADLIEKWFKGKHAFRVGKRKWDPEMLAQTMENVGGGWHGQGWLGKGKWIVSRTSVGADNMCKCCGEKLALIDLDPQETERFAESVASLAIKRERSSSFQKFQRWLDYYGPFEAVVDAANVGLFSHGIFEPSEVNLVANGLRHMLPSRKWPLIILHNKRLTGNEMNLPANKAFVERWKKVDALYATPTGSNDDWYWLYAAMKFKCLLVTNDEMRDHMLQLLGTDFFPKWKERHQVRFSFSERGPVFQMPPRCSVVIQESERGHWHIPIASENQSEGDRIWLCVTRPKSLDHTASANSAKGTSSWLGCWNMLMEQ